MRPTTISRSKSRSTTPHVRQPYGKVREYLAVRNIRKPDTDASTKTFSAQLPRTILPFKTTDSKISLSQASSGTNGTKESSAIACLTGAYRNLAARRRFHFIVWLSARSLISCRQREIGRWRQVSSILYQYLLAHSPAAV